MQRKTTKTIKTIIILIMLLVSSLLMSKFVQAYSYGAWNGSVNGGMPTLSSPSASGMFPQYISNTPSWVYCANSGYILRGGKIDRTIYYSGQLYYSDIQNKMIDVLNNYANNAANSDPNYVSGTVSVSPTISHTGNVNVSQPMHYVTDNETWKAYTVSKQMLGRAMQSIFKKISNMEKPLNVSDNSINSYQKIYSDYDGQDIHYGPKVCVMESTTGTGNGYTKSGSTIIASNNQIAYILTATKDPYNSVKTTRSYVESDVQGAYWLAVDTDGITQSHITSNARVLKQKAEEYERFLSDTSAGYYANIDKGNAQVIANQNTEQYIVGPFTITYPDYEDISYVRGLKIVTDNGSTLIYDETHSDFEIICQSGTTGSNGLKKTYPKSGTGFWIKFSAKNTSYPTAIDVYADFEYLSNTTVTYNTLTAQANIYQYLGYCDFSGDLAMNQGVMTGGGTYSYKYYYTYTIPGDKKWNEAGWYHKSTGAKFSIPYEQMDAADRADAVWKNGFWSGTADKTVTEIRTKTESLPARTFQLWQPYVKMSDSPVERDNAQPLSAVIDGSRTYSTYEVSTGTPGGPPSIPLVIELGGKVWVDGTAGKESEYDGLYNQATDKLMSGVKVTLYKSDGTELAQTVTDKNGEYLFNNLNAMFQYYVKFTYNGQYYQPTIYNADKTADNWKNTSKGLDILTQRDVFNAKFEEIKSSPDNVNGMQVYTRTQLEEMGAIDEFGNSNGTNAYADYCMMDSYTCNGTTTKDLYPEYKVFVIADSLNRLTNTANVLSFVESSTITILYGNPDLMHYVNQGYVLREELDLAMKKDVYNATLEINGKTQTYAYDKRQLNSDGSWEISARLSDGYYNATYSRELYKEDYSFKTDNYSTTGLNSSFDANVAGISQNDELKVYITYKLTVRNQSGTLAGVVTEIVDYYDTDYTFVPERTYLGDSQGNKIGDITGSLNSIYGTNSETSLSGYSKVYLTGMEKVLLDPDINKDLYVYVTFIVNKDNNRNIILDETAENGTPQGVGKENIAEINGYKSYYGSKTHAPNENNIREDGTKRTEAEYSGSVYDNNNNLIKQGDIAGKTDADSIPGNLNPNNVTKDGQVDFEQFEDDTDKSPNIRVILNRENVRTINGTVWEDKRTANEPNAQIAQTGDGVRDDTETGVNGVRVQLVEILDNGQEYIWKEVNSGDTIWQSFIIDDLSVQETNGGEAVTHSYKVEADGQYEFRSFIPGNYIVRFIYGDGTTTVLGSKSTDYYTGNTIDNPVTNLIDTLEEYDKNTQEQGYDSSMSNIGLNEKSYNGQDFKSTTYQWNLNDNTGVDNGASTYNNVESKTYEYNFSQADTGLYSDAKDIMSRRQTVEAYSADLTNEKAEILASFENIPTYNGTSYGLDKMVELLNQFIPNTYMIAESGTIDVNFEYNRTLSGTSNTGNSNIGSSNYDMAGYYNIENLDFGLEERPKAQLKVSKQVTNVKVTLANGSVLFDASSRATNVLWNGHIAHGPDTANTYEESKNYENGLMKTPIVRQESKNKGLIQLTIDEELMHGATIQVTYAITVANTGEVDYKENQFYYTGKVADTSTIVKTTPNALIDYVGFQAESGNATRNNLQFIAAQNPDWEVVTVDELVSSGLLNANLADKANQYTTIVKTEAVRRALKPIIADQDVATKIDEAFNNDPLNALATVNSTESVVGVQLVLSQMISADNSSDDMTYNNLVELVSSSNQTGRRMEESVAGNQDPTEEPREVDSDDGQEITILPPFGQNYIYYVLGTAIAIILIAGIAFVIRVVKKNRVK